MLIHDLSCYSVLQDARNRTLQVLQLTVAVLRCIGEHDEESPCVGAKSTSCLNCERNKLRTLLFRPLADRSSSGGMSVASCACSPEALVSCVHGRYNNVNEVARGTIVNDNVEPCLADLSWHRLGELRHDLLKLRVWIKIASCQDA